MNEDGIISLFLFLAAQTIALWRKLDKIEARLNTAAKENLRQNKRLKEIEEDLIRIKHVLGLS